MDALDEQDPVALTSSNQAVIGLAFALIKVRGRCDPEMAALALAAMEREEHRMVAVDNTALVASQSTAFAKTRAALAPFR